MAKMQEPGSGGEPAEAKEETSYSDWLRKQFGEKNIDVSKPFEHLSEDERKGLQSLLNNFYMKVPGSSGTVQGYGEMGLPTKYFDKIYPYDPNNEKTKPFDFRLSEKRALQSNRQFQESIKESFIKCGIDMAELEKRTKNIISAAKRSSPDADSRDWINLKSLPAVFYLLDSGYTIYDLKQ